MSRHNGMPPFRLPGPMPEQQTQMVIAAPLALDALIALTAAVLMAGDRPAVHLIPNAETEEEEAQRRVQERNEQANRAVLRAIDILGHTAFQLARAVPQATMARAQRAGEAQRKADLEAEQSQVADPPPPEPPAPGKIEIVDG